MALISDMDRRYLTALYDSRLRIGSNSSSRSGASSRDSSASRSGTSYQPLRKQSSPAYLSTGYPNTAWSTPSPVLPGPRRNSAAPCWGTIGRANTMTFEDAVRLRCGTTSSANDEDTEDPTVYRLRKFAITPKGVVKNRGDSYRPRSNSFSFNTPVGNMLDEFPRSKRLSVCSAYSTAETSLGEELTSWQNPRHRVLVSGGCGVGKTALTNQFLTSEYMSASDTLSSDDEDSFHDILEKSVSVLLDGHESELDFIDTDSGSAYEEKPWERDSVDAHVIVYNIVDRASFEMAIDILYELKQAEIRQNQAIILVGNKSDLVRARTVSTDEGKSIASSYDCKFIETSAGLNHNVDELLVGILTQIRLKEKQATKKSKHRKTPKHKGRSGKNKSLTYGYDKAISFLSKLLSRNSISKSCGNLHVV